MKATEFIRLNKEGKVPYEWIGQGYGYKDEKFDWKNGDPTNIIYIPENAYQDGYVEDAYSKQDFIDLCDGKEKRAYFVFIGVDWQYPETFYDECDFDNDQYWSDEEEAI